MPKAADLKRHNVVEIDGNLYIVKHIDVRSPSARGAATLYKVRFNGVKSGQKFEKTYKGDDVLNDVELIKRNVQFSYIDSDLYVFMDNEDFSQYTLSLENLSGQHEYLHESLEGIIALIVDGNIVAIELPATVILAVSETAPAIKGATATKRTKPATLSNGLVVQVPEYISHEDIVKVNTADGKFLSRA